MALDELFNTFVHDQGEFSLTSDPFGTKSLVPPFADTTNDVGLDAHTLAEMESYIQALAPEVDSTAPPTPDLVGGAHSNYALSMAFNSTGVGAVDPQFEGLIFPPLDFEATPTTTVSPLVLDRQLSPTSDFGPPTPPAVAPPTGGRKRKKVVEDLAALSAIPTEARPMPKKTAGPRRPNGCRNTALPPIALDAPRATRTYKVPSATSRKTVPKSMERLIKASGSGEGASGGLSAEQLQAIAEKREENALAARISRERKRAYISELEGKVDALTEERDQLKRQLEALLGAGSRC